LQATLVSAASDFIMDRQHSTPAGVRCSGMPARMSVRSASAESNDKRTSVVKNELHIRERSNKIQRFNVLTGKDLYQVPE
jgi:hypothetical protein